MEMYSCLGAISLTLPPGVLMISGKDLANGVNLPPTLTLRRSRGRLGFLIYAYGIHPQKPHLLVPHDYVKLSIMSSNLRSEQTSSNQDRSKLFAGYSNGQRNHFSSSSNLGRSGSFRGNQQENRITTAGTILPVQSVPSHTEPLPLSQVLSLNILSLDDQKDGHKVELRRLINALIGPPTKVSSFGKVQAKSLASLGPDELKQLKESISEGHIRARGRVKFLDEAITKLDKFRPSLLSRRWSRPKILATGRPNNPGPISSQNQASSNSTDVESRITEDRNKMAVPNKRLRTSVADIRLAGRLNNANLPRPSGLPDDGRDFLKPRNSSLSQTEHKDCVLPPGKGCWEKLKMKGKRSGIKTDISSTSMINKPEDQEHKLGVLRKSNNENQARPSENPRFRLPIHEENQAASSTAIIKGKMSQTPRYNSATSAISSQCIVRSLPMSDGLEQHSGVNRIHFAPGLGNCKRPAQTISSSSSVAQWVGQRPVKTARTARRVNMPPTAIQVDDKSFAEGFAYNDTAGGKGAKPDSHAILGPGVAGRLPNCNSLIHGKVKTENLDSSTGLSERGHLEGGDKSKSIDKSKKNAVVGVTFKQADASPATLVLPTSNSEDSSKEGNKDGIHMQGRTRRGLVSERKRVCKDGDKTDVTSNTKQLRSTGMVSDKVENKSSQFSTKKISSDCKPLTRSRRAVNSGSSDITGEMDDDHEEIVAAAEAAINKSYIACSGPFWKEMEHYFAVPTKVDIDYLKRYVDFACKTTPTCQTQTSSSQPTCLSNKKMDNDALGHFGRLNYRQDMKPSYQKCVVGKWFDKLPSLSEMVQSAFITEDATELKAMIEDDGEQHDNFDYMSEVLPSGNCNDIDHGSTVSGRRDTDTGAQVNRDDDRVSRSYACSASGNAHRLYLSGVLTQHDETGSERDVVEDLELDTYDEKHTEVWQKNQDDLMSGYQSDSMVSSILTDAIDYKHMWTESLDNRILWELENMRLFLEAVPDLTLRDDDEIMEELHKLQTELQRQESKNKAQIYDLEKAVLRKLQFEVSEREHHAMNNLLERAFSQHMGCRGTNVSVKNSGSKVAKQAALAFAKRTVERCRNFDATGRSCFTEGTLKEKLFCINSKETDINSTADTTECKTLPANLNSGVVSTLASENSGDLVAQQMQKKDMEDKEQSDSCQVATSSLELTGGKDDSVSLRTRKKEVLLEDAVGASDLRDSSVLGSSLVGGRKGKRIERKQEGKGKSKQTIGRMNNAKSGQCCLRNVRRERKTKRKPRQRTAQLSKEVNDVPRKPTEAENKCSSKFNEKSRKTSIEAKSGISQDVQCESEIAIDLSHLQLPGMEVFEGNGGLGNQSVDLESWLNFEEDIFQDAVGDDCVDLQIPMDDIFDLRIT